MKFLANEIEDGVVPRVVEDLSGQRVRLSCVSDSDSKTDRASSPRRMDEDLGGGPAGEQEDPASADPQDPMNQV